MSTDISADTGQVMTAQDTSGSEWRIRTDIPHPARVYDYWLGGKDNFEADRRGAEEALRLMPEFRDYALGNRAFLVRATRMLAEAGVRQYMDMGSGFLTSPSVHEIAKAADPGARVVYDDNDPVVFLHAEAALAKTPGTGVIRADYRDPETVLRAAEKWLDLSEPVALMFVASLHHITDEDNPAGVVASYLGALAPGSYLVISHFTSDFNPEKARLASAGAAQDGLTFVPRGRADIVRLFNGLPLMEPGLALVTYWRPDEAPGPNADRAWAYGGIASVS